MKPEIKQKWVEALRSDEYEQITGELHESEDDHAAEGFCCLGVLVDLYRQEHGGQWDDGIFKFKNGRTAKDLLPPRIVEWARLKHNDPLIGDSFATNHNDSGKPFTEIADLIEANL